MEEFSLEYLGDNGWVVIEENHCSGQNCLHLIRTMDDFSRVYFSGYLQLEDFEEYYTDDKEKLFANLFKYLSRPKPCTRYIYASDEDYNEQNLIISMSRYYGWLNEDQILLMESIKLVL